MKRQTLWLVCLEVRLSPWAKAGLWVWLAFVVFFAFLILYFFVSVGPPPQAHQQGVPWFYVRHWLAGVLIFPVYILVFGAILWFIVRIVSSSRKNGVRDSKSNRP